MTSVSDQESAHTESLLRQRLAQLADHAPTAVHLPGEVPVMAEGRRTGRGRRAGVIAAITALIGAGGFTTYSFIGAGNNGGTATPEEAVRMFVSALEHEDVLGMIDVTLPEEVGELRAAVDSITSDSKRVGLVADDFDVSGVQGVDVSVDDLALETDFYEDGLALVTATDGTLSTAFDSDAFSFGDKMREISVGDNESHGTTTWNLAGANLPARLMTVERGGRWYVSLEYTVAEYVRDSSGWELPGPVARTPLGFDSPEDAVTGFYDRLAALDLQGAIDTFAPGEDAMAWLAQSWLGDADAAVARGRVDGWALAINGLTYETIGSGQHLTLRPVTFTIEGTVPEHYTALANPQVPTVVATYDGSEYAVVPPGEPTPATIDGLELTTEFPALEDFNYTNSRPDGTIEPVVFPSAETVGPQPFSFVRADGCTTYRGTGGANTMFGVFSASPLATRVDGGYELCDASPVLGGVGLLLLSGGLTELPSVSVVQSNGKWYVSPLGTVLATVSTSLHDADANGSLFDSPIAPLLYSGLSRQMLEARVVGQPVDSVNPGCVPALVVEDGTITGVVADPPRDAVSSCAFSQFSDSSSGSAVVEATEAPVPETIP